MKLREEPSMGLFLTVDEISEVLGAPGRYVVGEEFDTWNDKLLVEKYVPVTSVQGPPREKTQRYNVKKFNRMVEGQFALHADTTQFRKNMHKLEPSDIVSITYKMHGTSWVVGNVLVRKTLNSWQKFLRWLGAETKEEQYDIIYSSRSVIKNKFANANPQHYYNVDLWGDIKDSLDGKIPEGITLYGEAVGYTSTGGLIQKDYDYGYKPRETRLDEDYAHTQDPYKLEPYTEGKHFGAYIYRITYTNINGHKIELSWDQIKEYCNHFGLKHVPELYYGRLGDWNPTIDTTLHWYESVLEALEKEFLEKDCGMCSKKIPAEGVVVRKDRLHSFEAYKLKSFRFLEGETKALDNGELDMETEQHEETTIE